MTETSEPDSGSRVLFFDRLERTGRLLENALILIVLLVMLSLAVTQIFTRNFFGTGFVWSDEFLRLSVLWLALIGAVAAARDHRHLRIDVLSHFFSQKLTRWTGVFVDLFTSGVCAVLAWYSYLFVAETREYEDLAFGQLPLWWFQIILPVGFALIAWRYLVWTARSIGGKPPKGIVG